MFVDPPNLSRVAALPSELLVSQSHIIPCAGPGAVEKNGAPTQWCIAKNIGGYMLETRIEALRRWGCWGGVVPSPAEPRPPTHSRHISGPQKPNKKLSYRRETARQLRIYT